jgi:hypothetical protein
VLDNGDRRGNERNSKRARGRAGNARADKQKIALSVKKLGALVGDIATTTVLRAD